MPSTQWTPRDLLRTYGKIFARKMGFIALGWIPIFFISQPFRAERSDINILMLFAPVIGAAAGLVAGWYMATDSVEDSGLHGPALWAVLIIGAALPIWLTEGILHLFFRSWPLGFGGWMLLTAATLLAMSAAIWLASAQE